LYLVDYAYLYARVSKNELWTFLLDPAR
jgi:hypothetical protein